MFEPEEPDFHKQTSECKFIEKIAFVINEVKTLKPYRFDILFEDPLIDFSTTLTYSAMYSKVS